MREWVKPGQKVTLIVDQPWTPRQGDTTPIFGVVYTIRSVFDSYGGIGIRFMEIINQPRIHIDGYAEVAFLADSFRPVTERKTDISVFQEILLNVGAGKVLEVVE